MAVASLTAQRPSSTNAIVNSGKTRGEWPTYGLDYAETRFSPLADINAGNVARLGLAWSYDVGEGGGNQEATPLVSNGVLYGITNWSIAFAVDARTGRELWRWDPKADRSIDDPKTDRVCCGVVSRGLALYEDKVIVPVIDGRLAALDAKTGRVLWEVQATPRDQAYTFTMAPRVFGNKIVIGGAGAEFLIRGYFAAYDVDTGREIWRFYTVPGDPSKPFENEAMRRAAQTWSGEWWKWGGGGSVWDAISYDPELDLVYVGTANGMPWPEELRGSKGMDNLYLCSILAVKGETGELVWYYQTTPSDSWDYDAVQQLTLGNLQIDGRERKVLMQANKNGFFYVLDRATGEFISATPYARVSWASGVDPKTGRPTINPGAFYGTDPVMIAPRTAGAHNWSPMAFNPTTGLVYIPATVNSSMVFAVKRDFVPGPGLPPGRRTGLDRDVAGTPVELPAIGPAPRGQPQVLLAWDPVRRQEAWRAEGGGAGGVLATASGLVFQSRPDGHLLVYRAADGTRIHDLDTTLGGGLGPPMTFALDGRQYIALMGLALDPRSGTQAAPADRPAPPRPKLLVLTVDGRPVTTGGN
jgi:quinohemoprotein ethanol dehydrogenase